MIQRKQTRVYLSSDTVARAPIVRHSPLPSVPFVLDEDLSLDKVDAKKKDLAIPKKDRKKNTFPGW